MKKRDIAYYIIITLIIILGCYFRINAYLGLRSLWHDESALACNLLYRNIFQYFGELIAQQSAPPLFLILTKGICVLSDYREGALRFIPLISSLLCLPVFFIFSQKFLKNRFVIILANFLFCINYNLIYYAQEFKQYSSDVLFFMITFLCISKIDLKNKSTLQLLGLGSLFALAPFVSVPTLFVIGAFFIIELIRGKKEVIKPLLIFFTPIIISFMFLYITTFLPQKTDYMLSFWNSGFLSLSLQKNLYLIKKNLDFQFFPNKFLLLIFILILTGFIQTAKQYKIKENQYSIIICFLVLIASALKLYPLMLRISLYILPIIIVFLVKPVDFISVKRKVYSLLIILLMFSGLNFYNHTYFSKITDQETYIIFGARGIMQNLKSLYNGKDLIIVNNVSIPDFTYYSTYYNFNCKNYKFLKYNGYDFKFNFNNDSYAKFLNQIHKNQKVWFFYSFDIKDGVEIPLLLQ